MALLSQRGDPALPKQTDLLPNKGRPRLTTRQGAVRPGVLRRLQRHPSRGPLGLFRRVGRHLAGHRRLKARSEASADRRLIEVLDIAYAKTTDGEPATPLTFSESSVS